jgi:polyhydroxyalkanoate synthesis regulator phasin
MKKKSDYSNEMEYIKEWCITVIDFKLKLKDIDPEMIKIYSPIIDTLTNNYPTNDKKHQKGLKGFYNSIKEEISFWPDNIKMDLNEILFSKFGENINQYDKQVRMIIKKILKRGKINDEDEFRLVNDKVNEICQIDSESSEIGELNRLLLAYEQNIQSDN